MQVYDFNRFSKHNIIGELRLLLCNVDWNHVIEKWQDLAEPPKFEVLFTVAHFLTVITSHKASSSVLKGLPVQPASSMRKDEPIKLYDNVSEGVSDFWNNLV